jgi:predicted Rossmann fold nucleotide-binding protein DprA/Smf involved in DNA uptake
MSGQISTFMVSGTRKGMTASQKKAFEDLLKSAEANLQAVRHGDCIGVDEEAHEIVRQCAPTVLIHVHPPTNEKQRAFCDQTAGPTTVHAAAAFLARDRRMVDLSDFVVAFPKGEREEKRGSGTWVVIRYARKRKIHLMIVFPDGTTGK